MNLFELLAKLRSFRETIEAYWMRLLLHTEFPKENLQKHLLFDTGYSIINLASNERADVAQSVERILGKDEVTGSNPVISSIKLESLDSSFFFCL